VLDKHFRCGFRRGPRLPVLREGAVALAAWSPRYVAPAYRVTPMPAGEGSFLGESGRCDQCRASLAPVAAAAGAMRLPGLSVRRRGLLMLSMPKLIKVSDIATKAMDMPAGT
jgi:hypothetical protein